MASLQERLDEFKIDRTYPGRWTYHPRTCLLPDHKSDIRIREGMVSRAFVGRS
jgi:hypothetical protein